MRTFLAVLAIVALTACTVDRSTPDPGASPPVARSGGCDSATDERLGTFADEFTNGPQTPERGATCAGGTPARARSVSRVLGVRRDER